ncbi:hypothetical protein ACWCXX_05160 [Streptomyces sp. NPDC001732]
MSNSEESEDLHGGPGPLVLLAVVFAVPVLKLAWTLGGGGAASEALVAMEPANRPNVLIGVFLGNALLTTVLSVVVSRITYAYFVARSSARVRPGAPLVRPLVTACVVECDIDTGQGAERARLVELGRQGNGVVGWDIEADEVVNGLNCGVLKNDEVRAPWWRS